MHGERQLQCGARKEHGDQVWIHVARRPPILIPAAAQTSVTLMFELLAIGFMQMPAGSQSGPAAANPSFSLRLTLHRLH